MNRLHVLAVAVLVVVLGIPRSWADSLAVGKSRPLWTVEISGRDYLRALAPFETRFEAQYAGAVKPSPYAYEAVVVFGAFWKASRDPHYSALALSALKSYGLASDQEIAAESHLMKKKKLSRPRANVYWTSYFIYLVIPVLEMRDSPQYEALSAELGRILETRAKAWPVYWELGAQNRAFFPAFAYDAARYFNRGFRDARFKAYSDAVWASWWIPKDMEEDCAHYSALDLLTLDVWGRIRSQRWWEDEGASRLWKNYAEQIANDGTWPPYGDGGVHGDYFSGLIIAEMTASGMKDATYKWLGHRAFQNGRARLDSLIAGIGHEKIAQIALAYLYADDSIAERAPEAGLTVTKRRFRERTDWSRLREGSPFYLLHEQLAPSKLVFRGGSSEKDSYLLVQAGSAGGHGHPDTGSVLFYGTNFSYMLSHGVTRLDHAMEQHNMFVLQDPDSSAAWKAGEHAVESTSVPVSAFKGDVGYARLEVSEYPATSVTESAWQAVKGWDRKGYGQRHAIGYQNWPVRLERRVLFVSGQFVVVRDVIRFTQPAKAKMGQNWVIGAGRSTRGRNWLDTSTPIVFGYPYSDPPKAPVELGDGRLLIWFAPSPEGALEEFLGPRHSSYNKNFINLPNRVWYPFENTWEKGAARTFTTVLVPHRPDESEEAMAQAIALVEDRVEATVLRIKLRKREFVVALGTPGHLRSVANVAPDAEALVRSEGAEAVEFTFQGKTALFPNEDKMKER